MTDKLKKLVELFNDETNVFQIVSKRYNDSVNTLSQLNSEIYKVCKEEGINIESLDLKKKN